MTYKHRFGRVDQEIDDESNVRAKEDAKSSAEDKPVELPVTIRGWIVEHELPAYEDRLEKLIAIGAPEVMIDGQRKAVCQLKDGSFKVGGSKELLDTMIEHVEIKRGNGGKKYAEFNGYIRYFPQARYGRYITA